MTFQTHYHCQRCGRRLKSEPVNGFGPDCARMVLGVRAKRVKKEAVRRDTKTRDLFEGAAA